MNHEFETKANAVEAGYIPANGRGGKTIETHRGIDIKIRDISGSNMYGYNYSISPDIPPYDLRTAESVTVSLTETVNKGGGKGSYTAMFTPGEYEDGVSRAKECIDRYLDDK